MLNQRLVSGKNLTPILKENALFNLLTGKLSLVVPLPKESFQIAEVGLSREGSEKGKM